MLAGNVLDESYRSLDAFHVQHLDSKAAFELSGKPVDFWLIKLALGVHEIYRLRVFGEVLLSHPPTTYLRGVLRRNARHPLSIYGPRRIALYFAHV